jgi:hypothetical protein
LLISKAYQAEYRHSRCDGSRILTSSDDLTRDFGMILSLRGRGHRI